jgi:hypothetical protein
METGKIAGVFVNDLEGREAKLVIWYQDGRFHDSYDVRRLCHGFDEIDVVRYLIKHLAEANPDFLERLAVVDERERNNSKPRRIRRYFSKHQLELYPNHGRQFAEGHSEEYRGLWIANNIGAREIRQMVKEMCDACKIKFLSAADLHF